jgi:hypothetical protein
VPAVGLAGAAIVLVLSFLVTLFVEMRGRVRTSGTWALDSHRVSLQIRPLFVTSAVADRLRSFWRKGNSSRQGLGAL